MAGRFQATFGGLSGAFWTLWTGTLINRLGGFVVPFLSLYLTGPRRIPIDVAGLIVSLFGLGTVCAGLVGGVLADRIGRRATLLLALGGGSMAMLALGFARPVWLIAPLVFLVAFLSDLSRPASAAMIADVVPAEHRLRAYGLQYWAINLGFSFAAVIAGLLANWSYLALFVGDAASTLIYMAVVYFRLPESKGSSAPGRGGHGLGVVFSDGPFLLFCAGVVLVSLVFKQSDVTMPIDMLAHGVAPSTYGLVIALNGVLIVLLSPWLSRHMSPTMGIMAVSALLYGAGFGIYGFAGPAVIYAAGVAVWTLGEIASSTASVAIVAARAPADARGRYQGFFAMSWGLAAFVGPTLGGLVYRSFGAKALWGGCAALGVLSAGLFLLLTGSLRTPPPSSSSHHP